MMLDPERPTRKLMPRSLIALAACGFGLWGWAPASLAATHNSPANAQANSPANPQTLIAYEYPANIVDTYLSACGSEGTDQIPQPVMQEICVCTIEAFQATYSLDEFRAIGQALSKQESVPDGMEQIMTDCAGKVMLRSYV
jgi:hypothetical protein